MGSPRDKLAAPGDKNLHVKDDRCAASARSPHGHTSCNATTSLLSPVKTLSLVAVLATRIRALAGGVARAQIISEQAPPPVPGCEEVLSRSFYAQGDLGALTFVGGNARQVRGRGREAFGVRLGYDLLPALAIRSKVHLIGIERRQSLARPAKRAVVPDAHLRSRSPRPGADSPRGPIRRSRRRHLADPSNVLNAAGDYRRTSLQPRRRSRRRHRVPHAEPPLRLRRRAPTTYGPADFNKSSDVSPPRPSSSTRARA